MRRIPKEISVLAGAMLVALLVRVFAVSVYSIPSESMLPRLFVGDYLIVEKWPYGWSGKGLPFGIPGWGRSILARLPERGDVVVFAAPPLGRDAYVKRVIGLPGDTVALRDGMVILNGQIMPRARTADLTVPVSPNSPCRPVFGLAIAPVRLADGQPACRYPRYRESLPGGQSYEVIDLGPTAADDYGPVRVPADRLFLLGDNRDRSADSRYPAQAGGGVGLVPTDDLIGRAALVIASVNGRARWRAPGSWVKAVRWARIGRGL